MNEPFIPPAPARVSGPSEFELDLAAIDVVDRLRPADPALVEALAASISENGLLQAITVRPADDEGNRAVLVAGAHRLAAMALLGRETIRARWMGADAAAARLVEIDENLIRAELTALDRAYFLAERKRIYLDLHPETGHGKAKKAKERPNGKDAMFASFPAFADDAAAKLGFSVRTIQSAIKLAAALDPAAIAALRGSRLADNAAQLKALAGLPAERQRAVAEAIASGSASVKAARLRLGDTTPDAPITDDQVFARFLTAWVGYSRELKLRIAEHASDWRDEDSQASEQRKATRGKSGAAK
jgi:ParB family chromosome partitioning protein